MIKFISNNFMVQRGLV